MLTSTSPIVHDDDFAGPLLFCLGLATLLAGCDKCGTLGPFFTGPDQKVCTSSTPQG